MADKKQPDIYYDLQGFPVYNAKDYPDREEFQAAALNDMEKRNAHKTLAPGADKTDFYKNFGKYIPGAIPAIGATIGDASGPVGSAAGAGIGSLIGRQLLQRMSPENFGDAPKGLMEGAGTTGLDIAANAGVPAALRSVLTKGISGTAADLLIAKLGGKALLSKVGLHGLLDSLTNAATGKPLTGVGQAAVDASRAVGSSWSDYNQ